MAPQVRLLGQPRSGGGLSPQLHGYFQDAFAQGQAQQNQLDAQGASQLGVNVPASAVSGVIRLPQPYRRFLSQYGVNPDDFQQWLNARSLTGQDYQSRVRLGQSNLPNVSDTPKLDQNKLALFGKVQAALSSAASDEQKQQVLRVAFGGDQTGQLAGEFGLWSQAQRNTGVGGGVLGAVARNPVARQVTGAFGNVLGAVTALGGLGREAAGVLLGARDEQGRPITAADVGHQAVEAAKAPLNLLSLGAAGEVVPGGLLKSRDRSPGWARIAETSTAPLWKQLATSPLGTAAGYARRADNRWVRDLGNVLGMGMDVATDPASYVSLGSGGAGRAATSLLGDVAERTTIGARLGLQGAKLEEVGRNASKLEEFLASQPDDAVRAARAEGVAAKIDLTNIGHQQGFAAYAARLAETTGADADKLFPRVVIAGRKADVLATQARGGVTLRGGVPFGARVAINVRTGTGALRGVRPLGSFFLQPGNRFTELASRTLDQISETFVYGAGPNRRLVHENPGLYNAVMSVDAQRKAVYKLAEPLQQEIRKAEAVVPRAFRRDPQSDLWLYDMIENGQRSRYRAALETRSDLSPRQRKLIVDATDSLHTQVEKARQIALDHDIEISTLREIAGDNKMMERYFPHRVRQAIGQQAGIAVAPTTVGPARARGIRAGTTIVGWAGNSQKLETGSFAEIQDAMVKLWGPDAAATWISDPFVVARAYVNSVIHAASLNHGYQLLTDAGLIVPDLRNFAESSIGGVIPAGDPVRSAWLAPREQADAAAANHASLQAQLGDEVASLIDRRASRTLEQAAQMRENLRGLGDRATVHDTQIGLLDTSVEYKTALENMARADYHQAVADADAMFSAVRDNTIRSVGPELRNLPEVKDRLRVAIADHKQAHRDTLRSLRQDLDNKIRALHESAPQIEQRMLADIKRLVAQGNSGLRPLPVVREELAATRMRLAQLEGGELAATTRNDLIERALRKGGAARQQFVRRQRTAAIEAEQLGSEIERAQATLRKTRRAGGDTSQLEATLSDLTTRRAAALQRAEKAGQQVSGVSDMLDTAEAAMRVADMREGQRLAAEAGASFDLARGISPRVAEPIARLLRFHAADLAREEKLIVSRTPEIKWTNNAAGWSREKLGAFGLIQPDGAARLGSQGDKVNQLIDAQARQLQDQWRTAVGDSERTFQRTLDERKRQLSAALSREEDLQERAVKALQLDPRMQALSAAQKEGDQLNMFSAELDKDVRQLEAWIDNRDEIKKAAALTSAALREATATDEGLRSAAYAAQTLLEQDKAASGEALAKLFSDARVFELMAPHVEHAAAVAGKLPFVEGGVVMPRDIADVLVRLQRAPNYRTAFGRVLAAFNTRWKRGVLLNPGSVVRRVLGNVYNATVLAGVPPEAFGKAFRAVDLWHGAKHIDDIADPVVRRHLKLAMQYNIFEGEISAMPIEGAPFSVGRRHPIQRVEEALQQTALHGEDIARLAQFIHGLDSGMSPATARLYTGRYHFFNTELTERERTVLRPAYPFYAYLRNNTALQVYTLFHNPGKIALYGYVANDLSAPVEGQAAPSWVTQQGGFALPWHVGDNQAFLANTMLDTSSLAIPYNIAGIGQGGEGGGLKAGTSPLQGDLTSSLTPAISGAIGLLTGRDIRQGGEAFSRQEVNPKLASLFQAIMLSDSQGRLNPRVGVAVNQLLPLLGSLERVLPFGYGGLTASQAEQQKGQLITKTLGPQVVANTPRQQAAYVKGQGNIVDQLVPASQRPSASQLTSNARIAELLAQLGYGGP